MFSERIYTDELGECVVEARNILLKLHLTEPQIIKTVSILKALSQLDCFIGGHYQPFSIAAKQIGIKLPVSSFCGGEELRTVVENRLVVYDDPPPKEKGVIRGLSHGFHRAITLPQVIESAIKSDYCHEHCWLLESEFRALVYKHKPLLNTEDERSAIAVVSGMADKVGVIRGTGYSNDFYRNIVRLWQPDVYFINESSGKEVIYEAEFRAKSVGAELKVIKEISRRHTSDFERKFQNFSS